MDDEQRNFQVESRTKKNHWWNEPARKLDGQTQRRVIDVRLEKETKYAKSCINFG